MRRGLLALLLLLLGVGAAEAAPTVATSTSNTTASGTSHTVSHPASCCSAGELLIYQMVCANSTKTVTWPGTVTQLFNQTTRGVAAGPGCGANGNAADACHTVGYRFADGSEGASITVTTSGAATTCSYAVYRITGAHASTAPESAVNPLVGSTSANPNPPSLDPSGWGTEDTLWVAAYVVISNTAVTSYPTNYTANQLNPHTTGAGLATATRTNSASSEDPGTFTHSISEVWTAYTLGVRPAAVGTPIIGGGCCTVNIQ